jgi:OOP family OmpA-OmpF porin
MNTKQVALGLATAAAFSLPSLATAQGTMDSMKKAMTGPESGWYVGAHIGQSDVDEINEKDTAFKVLGGYQINRNWGVELGYIDFGKASSGGVDFKGNAFELVGVGTFPVANQFSVYGKLGFARGEAEATSALGTAKQDSVEVTYGIGVQYDFSKNLGLRAEWQQYPDLGDGASDVSVMSIGVVYRFK